MTRLFRSEVYQKMYPDDRMMDAFGTLTPTTTERNSYFFNLWLERRKNRFVLKTTKMDQVKQLLKSSGLIEPWDFQVKVNEIRFECAEDLAMFKLSWGSENG